MYIYVAAESRPNVDIHQELEICSTQGIVLRREVSLTWVLAMSTSEKPRRMDWLFKERLLLTAVYMSHDRTDVPHSCVCITTS
jgi:hypothetical protein